MSSAYTFEKERLKHLLTIFMDNDCDFENKFPEQWKKTLTLYF